MKYLLDSNIVSEPSKPIQKEYMEKTIVPFYDFLPYDIFAARIQAELSAKLQSIGKLTPYQDTQIASIAIANNLILVTRNIKDFENIEKISNLKIENWFEI